VEQMQADTVAVLACPEMSGMRLRDLAWALERSGTELCIAPALLDVAGPRTTIRPAAGLPLLHVDHPEFSRIHRLIKSAFDRVIAAAVLGLFLPMLLGITLAIRLADGGPAFSRHPRLGKHGKQFALRKFRTTVADQADRPPELAVLVGGVMFRMGPDPEVTRIGRWLRQYELDGLPQLISVLVGDMSLVGPRAVLPDEVVPYPHHARRRLTVKPGITGLWQLNGRTDLPWEEAVRLDLRYVENWSFLLDLQILWRVWSGLSREDGAY